MTYLYPRQIMYLHEQIIQVSGGKVGLRDEGLLEAAVYRPQATWAGHDLYPDPFTKVAALGHSLIGNPPFVDGNKRVGFEAMRLMLRLNSYNLHARFEDKFNFVLEIAKGRLTEQAIARWLKGHAKRHKSR